MRSLSLMAALVALAGCDDGGDDGADAGVSIDIVGSWVDAFGTAHAISTTQWVQSFDGKDTVFAFETFDREAMTIIARNADENEFNGGLFSRFDWLTFEGRLLYCQIAFDKPTAEEAAATASGDPTDPLVGGCGMFPWSELLMP